MSDERVKQADNVHELLRTRKQRIIAFLLISMTCIFAVSAVSAYLIFGLTDKTPVLDMKKIMPQRKVIQNEVEPSEVKQAYGNQVMSLPTLKFFTVTFHDGAKLEYRLKEIKHDTEVFGRAKGTVYAFEVKNVGNTKVEKPVFNGMTKHKRFVMSSLLYDSKQCENVHNAKIKANETKVICYVFDENINGLLIPKVNYKKGLDDVYELVEIDTVETDNLPILKQMGEVVHLPNSKEFSAYQFLINQPKKVETKYKTTVTTIPVTVTLQSDVERLRLPYSKMYIEIEDGIFISDVYSHYDIVDDTYMSKENYLKLNEKKKGESLHYFECVETEKVKRIYLLFWGYEVGKKPEVYYYDL